MSSGSPAPAPSAAPTLNPSPLPIGQLESLKFKTTQIIDSIAALQRLLEGGAFLPPNAPPGSVVDAMPSWPDILAKYNLLLSQTHNLSTALVAALPQHGHANHSAGPSGSSAAAANPFAKLVLHPSVPLPDAQLDNDLIPLLRNQQTTEVLRIESDTVRRLATRLSSLPASSLPSGIQQPPPPPQAPTKDDASHAKTIELMQALKRDHDARCVRAQKAVALLRDKYDWHARVAVETAEPEDWIPPLAGGDGAGDDDIGEDDDDDDDDDEEEDDGGNGMDLVMPTSTPAQNTAVDVAMHDSHPHGVGDGVDEEEEEELEEVLGPSLRTSPDGEGI